MSRIFLTVEKCSSKTTLLTALLACVIAAAAGVRSSSCGVGLNCGQRCVFSCSDAQCTLCVAQNIRKEGQ